MKLKTKIHLRFSQIIWGVLAIILAIFFLRTAIWENQYYHEKEGSARATAINNLEEAPLEETPITAEQVEEYTVAPDRPRYLSIPKLNIKNARVLALGLTSSGAIATPSNIFDTGWYYNSAKPGAGGTAVIDGHSGGPTQNGIFRHLDQLSSGDTIEIELGNGTLLNYTVVDNEAIPIEQANDYMATAFTSPVSGQESITIISCAGTWSNQLGTYDHRQFVRAVRK